MSDDLEKRVRALEIIMTRWPPQHDKDCQKALPLTEPEWARSLGGFEIVRRCTCGLENALETHFHRPTTT